MHAEFAAPLTLFRFSQIVSHHHLPCNAAHNVQHVRVFEN